MDETSKIQDKPNKLSRKIFAWLRWIFGILLVLILLPILLLQIPAVQQVAKNKTVSWLEGKFGKPVRIGKVKISFPSAISLGEVFIADVKNDTLIYGGQLSVDIDVFDLLQGDINIREIVISDARVNIKKDSAGHFNFEHITAAFGSADKTADPDTSTAPFLIQLSRLNLNRVDVVFNDDVGGMKSRYVFNQMRVRPDTIDLTEQYFTVKEFSINGGNIDLLMSSALVDSSAVQEDTSTATASGMPHIKIKKADISELVFAYKSADAGMDMKAFFGNFDGENLEMALDNQLIDLGSSVLKNISFDYKASPVATKAPTAESNSSSLIIRSKELELVNSVFLYDDLSKPRLKKGMDYAHLSLTGLNLKSENLYVAGSDTIAANIASGSFSDQSGLKVNNLRTNLMYTSAGIKLNNLLLTTPTTKLERNIEIAYASTEAMAADPGSLWINADLKQAKISHKDLLTAVPMLYEFPMFAATPKASLQVNGKIKGYLKDLTLDNVTVRAFGGTTFKGSGRITGLPDAGKLAPSLNITEFSTTGADLRNIIPAGTLPVGVTLPEKINIKGKISGQPTQNLQINIAVTTSLGNAALNGYIKNASDSARATYDIKGQLKGLDLGKLMGQPSLGTTTLSFYAKGKGLEPTLMTGSYGTKINVLHYGGFNYQNIELNAKANLGIIEATASSPEDPHHFNMQLLADIRQQFPMVETKLDLVSLDLQTLGFSDVPFSMKGLFDLNMTKLDTANPEGQFYFTDLQGVYDTLSFALDTLSGFASFVEGIQDINVKCHFAELGITGRYTVSGLFPELINHINKYYTVTTAPPLVPGNQQATIQFKLLPSPQVTQFLPGIKITRNLEAKLDFDSKAGLFDLEGLIPSIEYNGQYISGGSFFAESADTALAYKVYLNGYESSMYEIPTLLVQGDIAQQLLFADVRLLDSTGRLQHTMAAFIRQRDSGYAIHFDPNSVVLEYEKWGLDPANELFVSPQGFYANSFTFSNGAQALVMNTFGDSLTDPIAIRLFNFKISTFTSLARQDSLYLDGTINGYAEVQIDEEHPAFFADIMVENLMFKQDTIGNITFKVNNEKKDIYVVNAALGGFENEVKVDGTYDGKDDAFDIQLDIVKLNLRTIEPFTMGYMNRLKGHLEGGISVTGTMKKPVVIGNMLFRDAEGNVPLLNSVFSLRNERIRFLEDGIHFNAFTLTDQNAKTAVVNGTIGTQNWADYRFNVDFEANDFRVINSTRRDNKLFYGTLFMDTKIKFRGTTDRPVISAGFRANEKTDLTMVLPQSNPEVAERQGVIEFFDADLPPQDSLFVLLVDSLNQSGIKGLLLDASLEIDPKVKLSFVIDESNGDALVAQGTANLSVSIEPSGKTSVTGTYELSEGSYAMSLKFMKFDFDIEKGSTITWTGEPMSADINVTALYNVRTAPYDLVEQQITGESDETKAKYKDRIPFRVKLMVKGELLKPQVSFDIEIAQTSGTSSEVVSTINSKLEQLRIDESQMNQQVFALILLGSFVPDNPFASSSSGSSASTLARQSVSKLLTSQLNTLARSPVSGVDIDIGLDSDEDYSTGTGKTRTDLNVAFSKSLLKDRLRITVGSNFELEGAARPNEKTSNIAGDIKADYALSRDGRYGLRAYRVDQYEVALQGQVVETGITFIINLNFDVFKELFEKAEEASNNTMMAPGKIDIAKAWRQTSLFWVGLLACFCMVSCSVNKYLKPGEVFYDGAKIKISEDSVKVTKPKALADELNGLLRPKPNKKILGRRQKVWYYYKAGETTRDKGFKYWMKYKLGEPPVFMTDVDPQRNAVVLVNYMENNGFFQARAKGDTVIKGKEGRAIYTVTPGYRYRIRNVYFPEDSSGKVQQLVALSAEETLLKKGNPYNFELIKSERARIDDYLKNRGYYLFDPDYLLMRIDSTIGDRGVNIYVTVKKETPAQARKPYAINNIYIFPSYVPASDSLKNDSTWWYKHYFVIDPTHAYKPSLFEEVVTFRPGMTYNREEHNKTLSRLVNIGTFKFVKNNFQELLVPLDTGLLNAYYYLYSNKKRNLRLETTGKTSSANLAGVEINLNWRDRNLFKGAEQLLLKLYSGFDIQFAGQNKGYNIYHVGVEGGLSWPTMVPFHFAPKGAYLPSTRLTISNEWQRRQKLYTVNTFKTTYAWAWRPDIRREHLLVPFQVTFVDNSSVSQEYLDQIKQDSSLARVIEEQLIVGPEYSFIYNNTINPKRLSGWYFKGAVDLSNNILGLVQGADAQNGKVKNLFNVPYSQFIKLEEDVRYYRKLSIRKADRQWVNRINIGVGIPYGNSKQLPYIKQFFTGGANSNRAFRVRSVGPGTYRPVVSPNGFIPDLVGDIKLELNSEYRAKLFGIVYGAAFVDAGNIWLFNENPGMPGGKFSGEFLKELSVGAGLGVRVDIAGIFMIRLDCGIPLRKPWLPADDRWVIDEINFSNSAWRKENLVANLAVGLPF